MSRNPWMEQHMAGEMEYTGDGYTRRQAAHELGGEYAGREGSEPCGECGAPAYFRATVGHVQCPSCWTFLWTMNWQVLRHRHPGRYMRDKVHVETRWR